MEEIRPIDANALKENLLKNLRCDTCYKVQLINLIDNAPTVNLEKASFMTGYNYGCDDGKRFYERPNGKWIIQPHSMIMKCSLCGHEENAKDVGTINPDIHFCSSCGAYMQKEGNE